MSDSTYIAVDIGAGSARVIAGRYNGTRLALQEVSRIENTPLELPSGLHWNLGALFEGILKGLQKAKQEYGDSIVSIGVDSFGNAYCLLGPNDRLLGLPYHYRDLRTVDKMEKCLERLGEKSVFQVTGAQSYFFNTLYQLVSDFEEEPALPLLARDFLFLPDLLNYWLTGVRRCERTIASCSQLYDIKNAELAMGLLTELNIPKDIFPELVSPGVVLGELAVPVQQRTGLSGVKVVTVASHDTASAVAGIPHQAEGSVFLSSGTWSLMGVELAEANTTGHAFEAGFTNELGFDGRIRFQKNMAGLWLLQESKKQWESEGIDICYSEMASLARETKPFQSFIDPNDPRFRAAGNMPERIRECCKDTGQVIPQSIGEHIRCIYESLAFSCADAWEQLEFFADSSLSQLNIVGGGAQDDMLNGFTADAIGKPVVAGPIEATCIGNILSQMTTSGEFESLKKARQSLVESFCVKRFEPSNGSVWQEARREFRDLVLQSV